MVLLSLAFTKDDRLYKNLKVLPKNITKQQMDSVMHHYTDALGVKCNFCHVWNEETKKMDFVSDANKHKLIARDMIRMTKQINKKYFQVAGRQNLDAKLLVTCYTCHHGAGRPGSNTTRKKEEQGQGPLTRRTNRQH
jgi:hypothetical protein